MPRSKFMNHKGQRREFTPIEELQRELEENLNVSSNECNFDDKQPILKGQQQENADIDIKSKKIGGAVAGLIEISNPNRPIKKSSKKSLLEESNEIKTDTRIRNKLRVVQSDKISSQAKADLARLAIVRKKREAAAELRLAAKRPFYRNVACPLDISFKKKNLKIKSKGLTDKTDDPKNEIDIII